MHPKIGLSEEQCQGVAQLLNVLLADEYILYTKTRHYHWNVVGPQFHDLHKLFEEQYEKLNGVVDDMAERIRMLGEPAAGTLAEFTQHTRLKEHPGHYPSAHEMLANLQNDHEQIIRQLRSDAETCAGEYQDQGTFDFLIGVMLHHEKMAWMLRAFLEGPTA
jgi:starvation-inducible DNA-binding protein